MNTRTLLWLGLLLGSLLACRGNTVMANTEGVTPLAVGGDVEDPLAELAALGDFLAEDDPDSGGSIRAKKGLTAEAKERKKRLKDTRNISAKVESIKHGKKFPMIALKLKVKKSAKIGAGSRVKKRSTIVVIPDYDLSYGQVDFNNSKTKLLVGSYYLQRGDKVRVRLRQKKGGYWTADYIERD